jgi:hypothetical protein
VFNDRQTNVLEGTNQLGPGDPLFMHLDAINITGQNDLDRFLGNGVTVAQAPLERFV